MVLAVPFALSLQASSGLLQICLSLLRITNYYSLVDFFKYMKQKMTLFNLTRIIEVMSIYFAISHLNACLFIRVGLQGSLEESWLSRVPSPQEGARTEPLGTEMVYIHGLYWSIITVSHIGTGDITPVSLEERVFVCVSFLLNCFVYAILFGNITSLVCAFACRLHS